MKLPAKALLAMVAALSVSASAETNPIIKDRFTADPAPMVWNDAVYLYTGHDEAKGKEMFAMWDWLCFSSKDMRTWTAHGPIMRVTDFKWATRDAWASQAVPRNGKFYFYAAVQHDDTHPGKAQKRRRHPGNRWIILHVHQQNRVPGRAHRGIGRERRVHHLQNVFWRLVVSGSALDRRHCGRARVQ